MRLGRRHVPTVPTLRVRAETHTEPFTLIVEPWGEEFAVSSGQVAVVVFEGREGQAEVPMVSVSWLPDAVIVYAERGCDTYSVQRANGEPWHG